MGKNTFFFGGFHFKPLRQLTESESERMGRRLCMTRDIELNLSTYAKTYTHEAFYAASTNKEADLFLCVENGKTYIPCNNELFWCANL